MKLALRYLSFASALFSLALLTGCGSGLATVSGTVTLDGEPLKDGTITFLPVDGATASAGAMINDGAYSIELQPGEKQVKIDAFKVTGKRKVYPDQPDSPEVDVTEPIIPEEYNANTTLTLTVTSSASGQDFELKSQ